VKDLTSLTISSGDPVPSIAHISALSAFSRNAAEISAVSAKVSVARASK